MVQSGKIYAWEFEQENGKFHVRVEGQLTFNTSEHVVDAALAGLGIAFLPEEEFGIHLQEGKLIRVLEEWCWPFPGYYRYYPSRKQPSPVFSLVVDACCALTGKFKAELSTNTPRISASGTKQKFTNNPHSRLP